ncbi:MAG: hypothetical protein Q8S27_02170 [Hoeflea sp.]|nr:hypothetical protein [Hoeflea sp.]MDP2121019.1 hypothetical protein [Hoeflea sp.]MDP3523356.1 hypothetical protein [Hoeflea sp.]MDZ7603621.1 hypothetical protein [Hoeflea sp.]
MKTSFQTRARTIVLQDAKRLPARFFAWMSGVRSGGARLSA